MSGVFHSKLVVGTKLGNGHFGEVYEADDPVHGKIAVKIITRDKAMHPSEVNDDAKWEVRKASIHKEAQFLSRATHRNVVPVHSINETPDGNSVQICMAYCPGGSYQSVFDKAPMALLAARKLGTEVLLGLGALHTRGMLHRDIKPGNILCDAAGVAQISDFGLVTDDLILGYGSQAGYSDHIAFEVWQGGATSIKSDIWAFGMTMFRMLHGKTWYEEAPSPQRIVQLGNFADTLKWLPHIPPNWRRSIRAMLRDDPAKRFQNSAQAMNAMSALATSPEWTVNVAPELVRWELLSRTRKNVVEWHRESARKHRWSAWSEPLGISGRKMTLGGSNGTIGRSQAVAELEGYFRS